MLYILQIKGLRRKDDAMKNKRRYQYLNGISFEQSTYQAYICSP